MAFLAQNFIQNQSFVIIFKKDYNQDHRYSAVSNRTTTRNANEDFQGNFGPKKVGSRDKYSTKIMVPLDQGFRGISVHHAKKLTAYTVPD